jgi:hypothetical protein
MSTRANIAIVLKDEDKCRALNFFSEEFDEVRPALGDRIWDHPDPDKFTDIYCNIDSDGLNNCLQIYNQHDGYPDHLLSILQRYYNSYEEALALILAGNTSFVSKEHTDAYAIYEDYERLKPKSLVHPVKEQSYLYVFKDGKWQEE